MSNATREDHPLCSREPTIEDVWESLRAAEFEYIDLQRSVLLYAIPAGDGWAMVIGHPHDAAYEWCYVACMRGRHVGQWRHSNCGYGGAAGALRDALIEVEGVTCCRCGCVLVSDDDRPRCDSCVINDCL